MSLLVLAEGMDWKIVGGIILAVLLALRLPPIRRAVSRLRYGLVGRLRTSRDTKTATKILRT